MALARHFHWGGWWHRPGQVLADPSLLVPLFLCLFSVSFNPPDHRMLGVLLSLVWAVFSPSLCFLSDVTLFYRKCHFVLALLCQVFAASTEFSLAVSRVCSSAAECGLLLRARALGMWAAVTAVHWLSCPWHMESSWTTRYQTHVFCIVGGFFSTGPQEVQCCLLFFFFF